MDEHEEPKGSPVNALTVAEGQQRGLDGLLGPREVGGDELRLHIGDRAHGVHALDEVAAQELAVRHDRPLVAGARQPRALERLDRVLRRAVADHVHLDAEALGRRGRDERRQLLGRVNQHAAVVRVARARVRRRTQIPVRVRVSVMRGISGRRGGFASVGHLRVVVALHLLVRVRVLLRERCVTTILCFALLAAAAFMRVRVLLLLAIVLAAASG